MIITIEIDVKSKNNLHYNKYNIIKYNNKCINNKQILNLILKKYVIFTAVKLFLLKQEEKHASCFVLWH